MSMKVCEMKTLSYVCAIMSLSVLAGMSSAPARAGQVSAPCTIAGVATFPERVHVQCLIWRSGTGSSGSAPGLPAYLAVEAGSPMAAHVVQLGLSALINARKVEVFYDDDAGANPTGCQKRDCRRLLGLAIR
jgi:hypothetical protein